MTIIVVTRYLFLLALALIAGVFLGVLITAGQGALDSRAVVPVIVGLLAGGGVVFRGLLRGRREPRIRPARAADPAVAPNLLPPRPVHFVGRTELLADMRAYADHARSAGTPPVIGLHGKGGVGKSTLAVQFAYVVRSSYPDGQLYFDLRSAGGDPAAALAYFLRQLGVDPEQLPATLDERIAAYQALLGERRVLVVLDGAEDDRQVRPLLPSGPGCLAVVTSRPPLEGVEAHRFPVDVVTEQESLQLLRELCGREPIDQDLAAAQEIVRLCGRLPLAVRICGRQISANYRPLAWHVERLRQRRLEQLKAGDLDVAASLSVSYADLPPNAQRAFRLLGLVEAPIFGCWVLAPLLDCPLEEAEQLIDNLVHKQLVDVALTRPQARYSMHELVREYAVRQLHEDPAHSGEVTAARDRLQRCYLGLAEDAHALIDRIPPSARAGGRVAPWRGGGPGWRALVGLGAVPWFAAEYTGLIKAVTRAFQDREWELCWRLSGAMARCAAMIGSPDGWQETFEVGLASAQMTGSVRGEALIRYGKGDLHRAGGRLAEATTELTAAVELFRRAGDASGEGAGLRRLTETYRGRGLLTLAASSGEAALELARRLDDRDAEARAMRTLGHVHVSAHRGDRALACFAPARRVFEEGNDQLQLARTLGGAAAAWRLLRRYDVAVDNAERARQMYAEMGNWPEYGAVVHELGHIRLSQGRLEDAGEFLDEARTVFQGLGFRLGVARVRRHIAALRLDQRRLDDAEREISEALEMFTDLGQRYWLALGMRVQGEIHLARRRLPEAVEVLEQALAHLRQLQDPWQVAEALLALAGAVWRLPRPEDTLRYTTEANDLFSGFTDRSQRIVTLSLRAEAARACGLPMLAKQSKQEAAALRRAHGHDDRSRHDHLARRIR